MDSSEAGDTEPLNFVMFSLLVETAVPPLPKGVSPVLSEELCTCLARYCSFSLVPSSITLIYFQIYLSASRPIN